MSAKAKKKEEMYYAGDVRGATLLENEKVPSVPIYSFKGRDSSEIPVLTISGDEVQLLRIAAGAVVTSLNKAAGV